MKQPSRVHWFVAGTMGSAAVVLGAAAWSRPPPASGEALAVGAALAALTVAAHGLSIRVSEQGSSMSSAYLPELTAAVLLGPVWAALVAGSAAAVGQVGLQSGRGGSKVAFNVAAAVLAATLAGLVYVLLGGVPSLTSLPARSTLPALFVAAAAHFAVNWALVCHVVGLTTETRTVRVLRDLVSPGLHSDIALSPIVYVVALLYLEWGPAGLALAVLPVLGIRVRHRTENRVRQVGRDLLQVLVKTMEAQDPYTSGHSMRVAEGAGRIARHLGLSDERVETVETAALLHDVGKVGAEFVGILPEERPLTEEQVEVVRGHPDRGVEILKEATSLDDEVLACVRHHHERVDGGGYPDGLSGEEIPLGSRIIAVCDAIDAMRTARPYRDPLSAEATRRELLRCRGSQFDPEVVDAALELGIPGRAGEADREAGRPCPAVGHSAA